MNKKNRIIIAALAAAIIVVIGIAAKTQKFAEPLTFLVSIIIAGQIVAIASFFLLRKKGYDLFDAFYFATATSIFSVFPGLISGLVEFNEETGNIGRSIFHTIELSLIVFAVVYLISGMKLEKENNVVDTTCAKG